VERSRTCLSFHYDGRAGPGCPAWHGLGGAWSRRTIAHVGFDDIPLAELLDPGITVIAQDPPALGELAAQMLLRRIRDPDGSPETVEVPTSLLTRGSGEIPPTV
jgi:LacI family transcriptional regulator